MHPNYNAVLLQISQDHPAKPAYQPGALALVSPSTIFRRVSGCLYQLKWRLSLYWSGAIQDTVLVGHLDFMPIADHKRATFRIRACSAEWCGRVAHIYHPVRNTSFTILVLALIPVAIPVSCSSPRASRPRKNRPRSVSSYCPTVHTPRRRTLMRGQSTKPTLPRRPSSFPCHHHYTAVCQMS